MMTGDILPVSYSFYLPAFCTFLPASYCNLPVSYLKIIRKSDSMRKNIKSLEVLIMCGKDRIRTYETL